MREIHINGRFLTSPQTGVQRVAHELIAGLDLEIAEHGGDQGRWRLIYPQGARPPAYRVIAAVALPGPPGQLWEQIALSYHSRNAVLVNLANTGPLTHARSVLMIHDAQAHTCPESYSRAFRIWYGFLHPRLARRAARLLTVSKFSADQLSRLGIRNSRPTVVIPNGVNHILRRAPDVGAPARLGLTAKPYVLAFASDQAHKNVDLLIRVFADPRLANVTLALIGGITKARGSDPANVLRLGRVDDAALRCLYRDALGFAFPSRTEGFGLPPGEAMACGAPVLAARAGALEEVYGPETSKPGMDGPGIDGRKSCGGDEDSSACAFLDPDDGSAWIEAVLRLRDDADWREDLIARGQKRAEQMRWSSAATALRKAILDIADAA